MADSTKGLVLWWEMGDNKQTISVKAKRRDRLLRRRRSTVQGLEHH